MSGNFTLTPFSKAYLSLGSNIDAEVNLRSAVDALRTRFGDITLSRACIFPAVGFDGDDFLNAAAIIDSDLGPQALNDWLHALEDAHGRDRSGPRHGNRPLDIDIVFYDELILEGPGHLQIPRNDLQHAFVLRPLAEIAPDFVDPHSGNALRDSWRTHPEHAIERAVVTLD